MIAALVVLACAVLNRVRGGGFGGQWLPGRALWWCAPAVAFLGVLVSGPWGALWGVVYLVWGTPAWGFLQLLGRPVDGKGPEPIEAALLRRAAGSVHRAFFFRHLLAGPLAFPILCVYEVAWRLRPSNPIWLAEIATGALWGGLIVLVGNI